MNGKNHHNKYRKSVYRRKNISAIFIILTVCLVIFIEAFLVVGNLLKAQGDKLNEPETENTETTDISATDEKASVRSILAHPVFLETKESGTFANRLDSLTQKGIYEASVPLNTPEGDLLFKSSVANSIGYPQGEANIKLENALPSAKSRNVYLSGIFYVNAFEKDDPLVRSVELSKSAALVSEALNAGFDDVVLIIPHMTADHVEEAIRFTESIKALTDSGSVGLCISEEILSLDNSQQLSYILDHLNEKTDFLAIDLSSTDVSVDVKSISDKISPIQHHVLMYKMRTILPNGETAEILASIISETQSNGIKNMQIIP